MAREKNGKYGRITVNAEGTDRAGLDFTQLRKMLVSTMLVKKVLT
jgi:hypothetical protein